MRLARSFLAALIAASLAIVLTLTTAELGALLGFGRNGHVNTALCCIYLVVIFHLMARQADRRAER